MSALTLYKKHSKSALIEMSAKVMADPQNKNMSGGIYLHTPSARKLMGEIDRAIAFHMDDDRTKSGNPVACAGYSGRNTNR